MINDPSVDQVVFKGWASSGLKSGSDNPNLIRQSNKFEKNFGIFKLSDHGVGSISDSRYMEFRHFPNFVGFGSDLNSKIQEIRVKSSKMAIIRDSSSFPVLDLSLLLLPLE